MKLCWTNQDNSRFGKIRLHQRGLNRFVVTYGLQIKEDLSYSQAALELGSCIMHQAACDDKLRS